MDKSINPVDLIVSFPLRRSMLQFEFSIKNYDCLKLRWSDLSFYFFCLISSFSLYLSTFFLYMKIDDKELVIHEISIFEFWFFDRWIGMNERWNEQSVGANVIGDMRYIRFFFSHEPLLTVFLITVSKTQRKKFS
jgi:hypothetical protein